MPFYGELYLRSTRPFLGGAQSDAEVGYLARAFAKAPGPIVDLGCGHGRHAARLQRALAVPVIGVELDPRSLAEREGAFPAVRADLAELPFRDGTWAGAFAWYATLFLFDEDTEAQILREVARCLRPGAPLILETVPFERLASAPAASFERVLPDGSWLREESHFDPRTGVDHGWRRLRLPEGRVLEGSFTVRHRPLEALIAWLARFGLSFERADGGLEGEPASPGAAQLIVTARRRV